MEDEGTEIVAGEGHTVLLTASGTIFAWGSGMFGRLGTGWEENEPLPVPVRFFYGTGEQIHPKIVSIAAGAYHSLAVSDDGVVWAWGYNAYHQLGRQDGPSCNVPSAVEFSSQTKITSVKAGGMTSCALEEDGTLWIWGLHPGTGMEPTSFPERVSALLGKQVKSVACGNEHVIAITASEIYAWGKNSHGQLGLGDTQSRDIPTLLEMAKEDGLPKGVSVGAYHSALVLEKQDGTGTLDITSSCWTFGLGENGQLGHGTTASLSFPKRLDLDDEGVVEVACGLFHTSCVTTTGAVLVWGMELGLGLIPPSPGMPSGDALSPLRIFNVNHFRGLACGASHTAILQDGGREVFAWGRNRHGVLGTGNDVDSLIPCRVSWPPPVECKALDDEAGISGEHTEDTSNVSDSGDHATREITTREIGGNNGLLEIIANLKEELSAVKNRASVLECAVHGGDDNVVRQWEQEVEAASIYDLSKYEAFYKRMRNHVKETILRRKVELWCKSLMPDYYRKNDGQQEQASYSVDELEALASRLNQLR